MRYTILIISLFVISGCSLKKNTYESFSKDIQSQEKLAQENAFKKKKGPSAFSNIQEIGL